MSELKVHASMCEIEPMVQTEEIRADFVKRLKAALANAGVADWGAGVRLSEMAGTTPKAAGKWLNGESMPGRANLLAIADALNVRSEWLQYGWGGMLHGTTTDDVKEKYSHSNLSPTLQPYKELKEYPLISWVAAGCWQESCDNFHPGDADDWLTSSESAGPNGYWLEVSGKSMYDQSGQAPMSFPSGYRVLVQPEGYDLISGKYYVARLRSHGREWETTFKQYVRDGGAEYLQPINPSFETIRIDEDVEIIGRVIDAKPPRAAL